MGGLLCDAVALVNFRPGDARARMGAMPFDRTAAMAVALCLAMIGCASALAAENEPKVVTLSCDGTSTDQLKILGDRQQPMEKMGVVVDLDKRTVSFLGYVARITDVDAANIRFGGEQASDKPKYGYSISTSGSIDRVTGHMDVTTTTADPTKKPYDPNAVISHYEVLCKATKRVF
jgi:hypothetical protein